MSPLAHTSSWTYADLDQFPDDHLRREIIAGELFLSPSPSLRHQRISARLFGRLFVHVERTGAGEVLSAPLDIVFTSSDVAEPDIVFYSAARQPLLAGQSHPRVAPDLAVEIVSPASRGRDFGAKKDLYARSGVAEYWVVNPDAATVAVFSLRPDGTYAAEPSLATDRLETPLLPGLSLSLAEIFAA